MLFSNSFVSLPNVPVNIVPIEAPAVVELKKNDLSRDPRFRLDRLATAGKNTPCLVHQRKYTWNKKKSDNEPPL